MNEIMNEPKQPTATEQVKAVLATQIESGGTVKETLSNMLKILKDISLQEAERTLPSYSLIHIRNVKGQQRMAEALQDALQMINGDKKDKITPTHLAAVAASASVIDNIQADAGIAADSLNSQGNPAFDTLSAKLATASLVANQISEKFSDLGKALPKALVEYQRSTDKTVPEFGSQVAALLERDANRNGGGSLPPH